MLERYALLSIAAAVATIALKGAAWWVTGSVGLLSDALESFVNLAAAVLALSMLRLAATPPDKDHPYGFSKAEYLAAGVEGALIVLAAAGILFTALPRLIAPAPLETPGVGLTLSVAASVVNLLVARVLIAEAITVSVRPANGMSSSRGAMSRGSAAQTMPAAASTMSAPSMPAEKYSALEKP